MKRTCHSPRKCLGHVHWVDVAGIQEWPAEEEGRRWSMERPEAGWGTWLLGKASASRTHTTSAPRMLPPQAKATEWRFTCWGQRGVEHLHRALWKTEPASGLRCPATSLWYRAASPPCSGEPRGWFRRVSCITKELSQPQKPQGGSSSAWGPYDRLLVLGRSGEDAPSNGYKRAEWWLLGL